LKQLSIIGKKAIEESNFKRLPGWHESYLNNALYSFGKGLVTDWVEYFRGAWAQPLYHDKFSALARNLARLISLDKGLLVLLDKVLAVAESSIDDSDVCLNRKMLLGERSELISENTYLVIENLVMEFIRSNKDTLTDIYVSKQNHK